MEKQKAIEVPASERYDSPYSGEQETAILQHAEKLKDQTAASDGDTVQVYDVDGNPHKVAKSELLKKSTLALPNLSDISKFVAVDAKGNAVGLMTKEQVAKVLGELMQTKKIFPFMPQGIISDANQAELSGFYQIYEPGANFPEGITYGVLLNYEVYGYHLQICCGDVNRANNTAHIRLRDEKGNWRNWRSF